MPHNCNQTIEALKLLNRPSINRFRHLLKRTGLESLMTERGALVVYRCASAAEKNRKHLALVKQHGIQVEQLDGDHIRELEPALSQSIIGGLFYPDTAHSINPHRLVTELAKHFVLNGGELVKQDVLTIGQSDTSHLCLQTNQRPILAKEVVIACGAWSKNLVAGIGHTIPLETERGYHLMLPTPTVEVTRPVTSFERSFVMTPMENGLRLAGTVELAGLHTPQNNQRATALFGHAEEILPGLQQAGASSWMGHRPSIPDSLPVIGRSPNNQRVLFAFGHQHLGLTQAAVTADIISEAIHHQPHGFDISPFRVDRF